ncbi:hypothetical protein [Nocardia sp. CNY236]|uniref:hypothetical protein n=1 Tax=Nocardia sp. CNY236 TaxID=1169152 RepID=UPI00040C9530|nr:hypothetical protein [Nocardia sp. CNY236]
MGTPDIRGYRIVKKSTLTSHDVHVAECAATVSYLVVGDISSIPSRCVLASTVQTPLSSS